VNRSSPVRGGAEFACRHEDRCSRRYRLLTSGMFEPEAVELTIPTADLNYDRIDIVCLADDGAIEGPTENAALKGTPAATPEVPATRWVSQDRRDLRHRQRHRGSRWGHHGLTPASYYTSRGDCG
jgi:hypothetical protein